MDGQVEQLLGDFIWPYREGPNWYRISSLVVLFKRDTAILKHAFRIS